MTAHPLQNPAAFREARHTLGLTGEEMAKALGLNGGRAIRGYEGGESNIPGPVARLVEVWLDPACPPHLRPVGVIAESSQNRTLRETDADSRR